LGLLKSGHSAEREMLAERRGVKDQSDFGLALASQISVKCSHTQHRFYRRERELVDKNKSLVYYIVCFIIRKCTT
jgi:hypothetical protein